MTELHPTSGGRHTRRIIVIAVLVVLAAGSAGVWAGTRDTPAAYRLAVAGPAEVTSTLPATGTVEAVSEATVGFPVSGQVSAVNVQIGQQVQAGAVLAQLDTTALESQLSSAQAKLATAQAKLANDQSGQTSAAGTAAGAATANKQPDAGSATQGRAAVAGAQSAVLGGQRTVDGDLRLVSAAINQANNTCRPVLASMNGQRATPAAATLGTSGSGAIRPVSDTTSTTPTTPSDSPTPTTSDSGTTSTSTSPPPTTTQSSPPSSSPGGRPGGQPGGPAPSNSGPNPGPNGAQAQQCAQQMQQVLQDQEKAAVDEKSVAGAENALNAALSKAAATAASAGAAGGSSAGSGAAARAGGSSAGSGHAPVTADQLAADQAAVDAADADQGVVQQNIAAATLVSPITGTVAQVGMTAGQTAATGSSAAIVIIGPGADQITTAVSDSQVGLVKIGQSASIIPDGSSSPLAGTVTAIGALGSTTSSGGASYPVTIALQQTPVQLYPGGAAAVSLTLAGTHAPVAVPSSAVHGVGNRRTVTVLRNGQTQQVRVGVGVVGTTKTEVTSGLTAGDSVVLADLNAAIPTAGANAGRVLTGGGGGGGARRGGG